MTILKHAMLSPDGAYRFQLTRTKSDAAAAPLLPSDCLHFVMLNPSTADANIDDPTIRRCMGFAWGYGYRQVIVTNLFAFRATKPIALCEVEDPIGPGNDAHIVAAALSSAKTILAWGTFGKFMNRDEAVQKLLRGFPTFMFGRSKINDCVKHPLYLPKDARLEPCPC